MTTTKQHHQHHNEYKHNGNKYRHYRRREHLHPDLCFHGIVFRSLTNAWSSPNALVIVGPPIGSI